MAEKEKQKNSVKKYKVKELFKKHVEKKKQYLLTAFCVFTKWDEEKEIEETEFLRKLKSFKGAKIT